MGTAARPGEGHRRPAAQVLAASWRRVQVVGAVAVVLVTTSLLVPRMVAGGPGRLVGSCLAVAAAGAAYGSIRSWLALLGFDRQRGQAWRVGLTALSAGELPTGSARVIALRPWLPSMIDNARARIVIAERYPHPPAWWEGPYFSFPRLRRIADDDAFAIVLSSADGRRILMGRPGQAGVVLRRIPDPQVPASRRRDHLQSRLGVVGWVGFVLGLVAWLAGRLDLPTGPLGILAVVLLVGSMGGRIAITLAGVLEARALAARPATTLVPFQGDPTVGDDPADVER